ncbi:MAG: dihydrofolate reductase [Puniceicoccaceae bacterium]
MGIQSGTNGGGRAPERGAPDVRAIAAVSLNRVIGRGGGLPWDLPEDVAYLHECVRGGVVVEGRRCYESRGRAFPGAARTIVLSGRTWWNPPDATVLGSLEAALSEAAPAGGTIWIAGGERVYAEGLPFCRRLHLTLVHREYSGDTFFPEWRDRFPVVLSRTDSEDGGLRYSFLVLAPRGAENPPP